MHRGVARHHQDMMQPDNGASPRESKWRALGGIVVAALLLHIMPLTYAHVWDEPAAHSSGAVAA